MKSTDTIWARLVQAARNDVDTRSDAAPFGFSTRVAALGLACERLTTAAIFERLSLRALVFAGLLAIAALASSYPVLMRPSEDQASSFTLPDPVIEILDLT